MAKNKPATDIEKIEKIEFTGEIFMRERIDEDTGERRYSVAIAMNNPFVDLFEGGADNEYNHRISLGFKENKGKAKAQFNFKAKKELETCDKIEFVGYAQRRKFYDENRYKAVRYLGIFIRSPFDDSEVSLTIPRADTLGLFEMFANERLVNPR